MRSIFKIATKTGVTYGQTMQIVELLFEDLHRNLLEYEGLNGDYVGEELHHELSDKAFYHFLGMLEQFSRRYDWEEGAISEYLGQLPPTERWEAISNEIKHWKRNSKNESGATR